MARTATTQTPLHHRLDNRMNEKGNLDPTTWKRQKRVLK